MSVFFTRNTEPTRSPSCSAIQHRSRRCIEVVHEFRDDLRDERLEALIPSIFARVEDAVPKHDPPNVARLMRSYQVRPLGLRLGREHVLDRAHGVSQATPVVLRDAFDERRAISSSARESNPANAIRPASVSRTCA